MHLLVDLRRLCNMFYLVIFMMLATAAAAGYSNDTCVAETCQGVPPKYTAIPGLRIRACQEAGHTWCPIHKVNALSESHCWKLCESLASCCRLFTYNAKLGQCFIYDQDFYTSWTSVDASDGNWTSYYKQREDGWKLLYKMSQALNIDAVKAWEMDPGQPFASEDLLGKDDKCRCYVKSQVADYWSKFPITQAHVSLVTAGSEVKHVRFSSVGETPISFFNQKNILSSGWTDLNPWSPVAQMSLNAYSVQRGFIAIKKLFFDCNYDIGWISVWSRGGPACTWDRTTYSTITYLPGPTADFFSKNASFADAIMIYAKM